MEQYIKIIKLCIVATAVKITSMSQTPFYIRGKFCCIYLRRRYGKTYILIIEYYRKTNFVTFPLSLVKTFS